MPQEISKIGASGMSELSEARIMRAIENLDGKVNTVRDQLTEVVRLQEQIRSVTNSVERHTMRLDDHERRLRDSELKNVGNTSKGEELESIKKKLEAVEAQLSKNSGQKDVAKEFYKWFGAVAVAIIVWLLNSWRGE